MKTLLDLLAIDNVAQKTGSGLNSELRNAIEASVRFPSYAASPARQSAEVPEPLPANVTPLTGRPDRKTRRFA